MANRDVVAVGASAGGVEALRELMSCLPADLPATVLVVLHLPASAVSALPSILGRSGELPVMSASADAPLRRSTVLVAPPDRHLLVQGSAVTLGRGPRENGYRPAIDPLFRSAARWHGQRVIGLVLSGALDDGAAGLWTIANRGGVALVQDPDTALYPGMPRAALAAVPTARAGSVPEIAKLVIELCGEEVDEQPAAISHDLKAETDIPDMDEGALADPDRPGRPAAMTCPDCNGAMFEFDEGGIVRYRCRVGHAWSAESLLLQQVDSAEIALWAAIRALEEKAALHTKLVGQTIARPQSVSRAFHAERAAEAKHSAAVLREMLRNPFAGDTAGGATESPLI